MVRALRSTGEGPLLPTLPIRRLFGAFSLISAGAVFILGIGLRYVGGASTGSATSLTFLAEASFARFDLGGVGGRLPLLSVLGRSLAPVLLTGGGLGGLALRARTGSSSTHSSCSS